MERNRFPESRRSQTGSPPHDVQRSAHNSTYEGSDRSRSPHAQDQRPSFDVVRDHSRSPHAQDQRSTSTTQNHSIFSPERWQTMPLHERVDTILNSNSTEKAQLYNYERFKSLSYYERFALASGYRFDKDLVDLYSPKRWETFSHDERIETIKNGSSADLAPLRAPERWATLSQEERAETILYSNSADLGSLRTPERWGSLSRRERGLVLECSNSADLAPFRTSDRWRTLSQEERGAVIELSNSADLAPFRTPERWATLLHNERVVVNDRTSDEHKAEIPTFEGMVRHHPAWNSRNVQDRLTEYNQTTRGTEAHQRAAIELYNTFETEFQTVNQDRERAGQPSLNWIDYANLFMYAHTEGSF